MAGARRTRSASARCRSALIAAFVVLEARLRNPIMPLRVFAIPGLAGSSFIRGLLITGMFATFFIGVLYLERIRGYGALTAGLAFLPQTLLLGRPLARPHRLDGQPGSGRASRSSSACASPRPGWACCRPPAHTAYAPVLLGAFLLMGLGAGMSFMPL